MTAKSPATSDPRVASIEFEYHFSRVRDGDDSQEVTVVTATNDREAAEEKAWHRLANSVDHPVDLVEADYSIERRHVRFHDPPWTSGEDLLAALEDIDGVQSVYCEPPMEGTYGPPRYHLSLKTDDVDAVRAAVDEYYPGLSPEQKDNGGLAVICSPLHA